MGRGSVISILKVACAMTQGCKKKVVSLQLRAKQTAPLVNKHYQNEVTLTGQNPPLKCCQPLESLARLITDLSMIEIWGL